MRDSDTLEKDIQGKVSEYKALTTNKERTIYKSDMRITNKINKEALKRIRDFDRQETGKKLIEKEKKHGR